MSLNKHISINSSVEIVSSTNGSAKMSGENRKGIEALSQTDLELYLKGVNMKNIYAFSRIHSVNPLPSGLNGIHKPRKPRRLI